MLNQIRLFILVFFISIISASGTPNLIGIGSLKSMQTVQVIEYSIMPNFRYGVSLYNPATWHNLKFTQLSMKYNGIKNSGSVMNIGSGLSKSILIIPFKKNSAIGFSLEPYSDQNISLRDSLTEAIFIFEDTLNLERDYIREGGLISLQTGYGYKLNDKISGGANLSFVFGSTRASEQLKIDQVSTIEKHRYNYSGVLFQGFTNFYFSPNLAVFLSIKMPVKSLETIYQRYHLFEDLNGNGFHDNFGDFPSPIDISAPKKEYLDEVIHSPSEIIIGLDRKLFNRTRFHSQFSKYSDKGVIQNTYNKVANKMIKSSTNLSLGLIRFSNDLSTSFYDRFIFKMGFDYKNSIITPKIPIREFGYALGISFKFKSLNNQIDFSYSGGFRSYDDNYKSESFQQLQVGLTIADLWFVKRRQRRNE